MEPRLQIEKQIQAFAQCNNEHIRSHSLRSICCRMAVSECYHLPFLQNLILKNGPLDMQMLVYAFCFNHTIYILKLTSSPTNDIHIYICTTHFGRRRAKKKNTLSVFAFSLFKYLYSNCECTSMHTSTLCKEKIIMFCLIKCPYFWKRICLFSSASVRLNSNIAKNYIQTLNNFNANKTVRLKTIHICVIASYGLFQLWCFNTIYRK